MENFIFCCHACATPPKWVPRNPFEVNIYLNYRLHHPVSASQCSAKCEEFPFKPVKIPKTWTHRVKPSPDNALIQALTIYLSFTVLINPPHAAIRATIKKTFWHVKYFFRSRPNVCVEREVTLVAQRQPCVQAFTRMVKVWKQGCVGQSWCMGYERRWVIRLHPCTVYTCVLMQTLLPASPAGEVAALMIKLLAVEQNIN